MSINKFKSVYDPAESDDYDVVGSYLRSSDGTHLTHTTDGAKEALDVHIAGSDIQLEVDLAHTEDSVRLGDGTSFFTSTSENGDISLDVHISNSDLDIRDLDSAQDNVEIQNAAGQALSIDGSGYLTVNGNGTFTVAATDLDIRDLSHAQDSVKVGDGADFLGIESDGSINVNATEQGFSSCNNPAAVAVGATATDLLATDLANRKEITIQNTGAKDAYIGCDSGVTSAKGLLVPKGGVATFRFGAAIDVHAITASGSTTLRVLELA